MDYSNGNKKIREEKNKAIKNLEEWKKKLKKELSNNNNSNTIQVIKAFLVEKELFDKYEKIILKNKSNMNKDDLSFNNLKIINEQKQFLLKEINFNTRIELFPLNLSCWLDFKKYVNQNNISREGQFLNDMLIFEMKTNDNSKLYVLFFLDKNNNLRQAYLQINDSKVLFKHKNFLELLKTYDISANNDNISHKSNDLNFNLYIFKYNEKKEDEKYLNKKKEIKKKIDTKSNNNNNKKQIINGEKADIKTNTQSFFYQKYNKNDSNNKNYIHTKNNEKIEIIKNVYNKKIYDYKTIENNFRPKKIIKKNIHKFRNPSVQIRNLNSSKKLKDKYELNLEEFLPVKTVQKLSTPGIIGLSDLNPPCYMNAILQCFSNIPGLRNELLRTDIYHDLENNKNTSKKLSFALAEVLKNLWENINERFYSPENFKKEINNLFKENMYPNIKDFIINLLNKLHQELNHPQNNFQINNNFIDNRNFKQVFNYFYQNFISQNNSIISDVFFGFSVFINTCLICKNETYNINVYNNLSFNLKDIASYKNNNNILSINDCFDYNEKKNIFPSFNCRNCKQNQAIKENKLFIGPKTLIINFDTEKDSNINISLDEYLNLREYISYNDSPYYYELVGVICLDSENNTDNFIAFCKNSENCNWYKYNNENVSKCLFNEIRQNGKYYTLFYHYIKT